MTGFYQRVGERRSVVTAATILKEDDTTIVCETVNMSSGGIKLALPRSVRLPSDFRISVVAERVKNRRARMVWRIGDEVGIRFV